MEAVLEVYPRAIVQWEDFKQHNAIRLLDRYRRRIASFNDDIQGTGAVALGGILAACRHLGEPLTAQRFVMFGAGAAGVGISRMLRAAMRADGLAEDEIRRAIVLVDSTGVVYVDRPGIEQDKTAGTIDSADMAALGITDGMDLAAIIDAFHPSFLIGTSGRPGAFTREAIEAMARHVRVPFVMPLSNPTDKTEALPADILAWTEGRAIVATGSPFPPVDVAGRDHVIGQANNVFIFPGLGLGCIAAEIREVTDDLFLVAARTLADMVSAERLEVGAVYPHVNDLRAVSRAIALAVARTARDAGAGRAYRDEQLVQAVDDAIWYPAYVPYEPI